MGMNRLDYHRVPAADLPAPTGRGEGCWTSSGDTLTCDAGLAAIALLHHAPTGAGAVVVVGGTVQTFATRADQYLADAVRQLVQGGAAEDHLTCTVLGASDRTSWQTKRLSGLARARGWPTRIHEDANQRVYRRFAFSPKRYELRMVHDKAEAPDWSPAASALGVHDSIRVFTENALAGKVANASRFFREERSYRGLRELILPRFLSRSSRLALHVWCAGCSTGEEVYSYAMYILRLRERTGAAFPVRIFGTDINTDCLTRAQAGVFDVPKRDLDTYAAYFRRFGTVAGQRVTMGQEVRDCIRFRPFDMRERPKHHRFHLVVCANVFQYYNDEARRHFLTNFASVCQPEGFIYVNHVRREMVEALGMEFFPEYGLLRPAFQLHP